jgi:hypothetical protein
MLIELQVVLVLVAAAVALVVVAKRGEIIQFLKKFQFYLLWN